MSKKKGSEIGHRIENCRKNVKAHKRKAGKLRKLFYLLISSTFLLQVEYQLSNPSAFSLTSQYSSLISLKKIFLRYLLSDILYFILENACKHIPTLCVCQLLIGPMNCGHLCLNWDVISL